MPRPALTVDTIVASFARPDSAKAAVADLERAGIGPTDVTLLGDGSGTAAQGVVSDADDRKVRWIARRWARGAALGAAIGAVALVGALAVVREGALYPAWIPTAAGGAVAGAFVGGLLWLGATMPRNPQAWDTHLAGDGDRDGVRIAVRLRHPDDAPAVTEILRRRGATTIDGPPPDGGHEPPRHARTSPQEGEARAARGVHGGGVSLGPVEYVIIGFPGDRVSDEIAPALSALVASDTVRILDLLFVFKDERGQVVVREFDELDPSSGFADVDGAADGVLNEEDALIAADALEPGTSGILLVWEDRWAGPFADSVRAAGGVVLGGQRLSPEIVESALAGLPNEH